MGDAVLILNAGSSSIKFGVFDIGETGEPVTAARGTLETGETPRLVAKSVDGAPFLDYPVRSEGVAAGIAALLNWLEQEFGQRRLVGCGHRIVHGGTSFSDPVLLTPPVLDAVESLTPLAPLHQRRSIAPIRALAELRPQFKQVGCFDTAFHHTIEPPASRFALPRSYEERGIRRFGFHGLSYEYIAACLDQENKADRRTVVAHLGNGASLCAMRHGRSLDTTMGFSALDGLVMGTRCGAIDPGVLLYLLQHDGMTPDQLQDLLYYESGLLGVSGISGDMRDLERSKDSRAHEAVELFVFRVAREVAALAGTLGGLDCLVFTGGIGEHSPAVRKPICDRLNWLGVSIDDVMNLRSDPVISLPGSAVDVRVMPTDEEIVIARHTLAAIGKL
jgi:acetate kinase